MRSSIESRDSLALLSNCVDTREDLSSDPRRFPNPYCCGRSIQPLSTVRGVGCSVCGLGLFQRMSFLSCTASSYVTSPAVS